MEPLSHRLTEPEKLAETWKDYVVETMSFQDSFSTHFYRDGDEFSGILATAPFYGSRPYQPELLTYWEGQMIQKHLDEIKVKDLIKE